MKDYVLFKLRSWVSFILSIFLSNIKFLYCSKLQNDYIITNITYSENRKEVTILMEYNSSVEFDIKDYDITNIRKNSTIELITNLKFKARVLSEKIFHFYICDQDKKRFGPSLESLEFNGEFGDYNNTKYKNNRIDLEKIGFEVSNIGEPFSFSLKDKNNNKYYIFDGSNFLFTNTLIMFDQLLTTIYLYGFGERNFDFNLKIGKYTTWPNDTTITYRDQGEGGYNLMGHQPIGLHRTINKKYLGFIFMNINAQDLIINKTLDKYKKNKKKKLYERFKYYMRHITIGGIINYYITLGDTPEEALGQIHRIIGRPLIPPFWALGWHQCRWGYKTTKELIYVLKNYTLYNIPLEAIWSDLDLLKNKSNFKISVEHLETPYFVDMLHSLGKKFVPLLDYGIPMDYLDKYYLMGKMKNSFIKSNFTKNDLITYVWPGYSVFPDLFVIEGQEIWIEGLYDFYLLINYDGLWIDMNEPAMIIYSDYDTGEIIYNESIANSSELNCYSNIPYIPGERFGHNSLNTKSISVNAYSKKNDNKTNYYTMYNIKPLISKIQCEITYRFFSFYVKKRPFVVSRGNTIGHGNFAYHWLGDNKSNYNYLRWSISGIFNYNIFGIPFTGADICGFHGNATDELCARWHVLGAFYPFSRNHNVDVGADQEPWSFSNISRQEITNINDTKRPKKGYTLFAARKAIKMKYSLLRYTYSQLFLISLGFKGAYFKPCFFEFPNDQILLDDSFILNTHIMVGDSLLFIPKLLPSDEDYIGYFPNSNFNTFPDGFSFHDYNPEYKTRGKIKFLKGDYLTINIFLRGGKIIPYQDSTNVSSSDELRNIMTSLIINPDQNLKAEGHIIYDCDENFVVENRTYLHNLIIFNENIINFRILNIGKKTKNYTEHLLNDIIFYRATEINSGKFSHMENNFYTTAEIKYIDENIYNTYLKYEKNNTIFRINSLKVPIYLINSILLK